MDVGDEVIRKHTGERYVLSSTSQGSSGGCFGLEYYLAPHASGPPSHSHDDDEEYFEIIAGRLHVWLGNEEKTVCKGDRFTISAGAVHRICNDTDKEVHCRIRFSGEGFEKVLAGLHAVHCQPLNPLGFLRLAVLSLDELGTIRPGNPLLGATIRLFGGIAKRLGFEPPAIPGQ